MIERNAPPGLAAREDLTVSDYVHILGQSQPRISRHLKLLAEAGLLERFRDLVIVDANPIQNLKVLYGTGWFRLNDATGQVENYGGVKWTIKDGIIYDAKKLLADIEEMGNAQRRARAAGGTR